MFKLLPILFIGLVLNSCGDDLPTRITSENLVYENKNTDSDLSSMVDDALDKVNEIVQENVSMENFPQELIGVWCDDCDARNASIESGMFAEFTYFMFDANGEMEGGFQYETSTELTGISGSNGSYQITYNEIEFGGTSTKKKTRINVEGNKMLIDRKTFYKCQN